MPECSNPVQCQTAKREECTCDCGGANHGVLRKLLESDDPSTQAQAEEQLSVLKQTQAKLKKEKRVARRQRRAELKKVSKGEVNVAS